MTDADFRRKYLYDDSYMDFSKKLSSSGKYTPRSLDSYIPADRLESKVKRKTVSDNTTKIGTREVSRASSSSKKSTSATKTRTKKSTSGRKPTKKNTKKKHLPLKN